MNISPVTHHNEDISPLATALREQFGDSVRFDSSHRAAYASDASNYRQTPIGVVIPSSLEAFEQAIAICAEHHAPVLPRGGGTSQCGQTVNEAVVFDLSQHCNQILEIDPMGHTAVIEPGVVCDALRSAAEQHGMTFGPDPATHSRCTLGGMIGNNSCGAHSVMAGKTVENVEALEVLTYDGAKFWVGPTSDLEYETILAIPGRKADIYRQLRNLRDRYAELIRERYPSIKRRVSGYNLDQLLPENGFNIARALVGSEGTCALTLRAKVRLVHSPAHRVMLVLGFADIYAAADAAPQAVSMGTIATEGLDKVMIDGLRQRGLCASEIAMLPVGSGWLLLEFGGDSMEDALSQANAVALHFASQVDRMVPSWRIVSKPEEQALLWRIRETGASATSLSLDPGQPDPQVGWEDAAVDPARLGAYLREFQALVDQYGYRTCIYGHFGDGCVHARITFDLRTVEGVQTWRKFMHEVAELVVSYGGSLSGEHGDGQARAEFLPLMFGPELMEAMEEFKRIWDPRGKLNPGKVVKAYRIDENLRMGPAYRTVTVHSRLQFQSPEGDGFQRAVERCIGMGKCRSVKGGTMCPSYRATREERYSTRGRAHLLWEMLQGEVVKDGWRSPEVKEALDTCLSCKGCRSDCPTHTDMASYKAEFLSHYHDDPGGRMRPRQAWSMGRMGDWAPLAMLMPKLSNWVLGNAVFGPLAKWAAGVSQQRELPRFAAETFQNKRKSLRSGEGLPPSNPANKTVLLWVDTFCDHFDTDIADAAVEVLEHAGFNVVLPERRLCCGRPLYDFGFLDLARERLSEVMCELVDRLDVGRSGPIAVVGLEPGCMSVFKDELLKLFPDDLRAQRLSAISTLLGDFLVSEGYRPPPLHLDVTIHTHCHQRSLFNSGADQALLKSMGATCTMLDSGCCGMAGSFGFHPNHVEMSKKIAELSLFPALRNRTSDSVVMTNGFSCREQIHQGLDIQPQHLAQLLRSAIHRNRIFEESNSTPPLVTTGDLV